MTTNIQGAVGPKDMAKAGITMGDVVWLRATRNSMQVRSTPRWKNTLAKLQSMIQNQRFEMQLQS